jgi:hypothetical protein
MSLSRAEHFLSGKSEIVTKFRQTRECNLAVINPWNLRKVIGEPFEYLTGSECPGFFPLIYLELLIPRIPLLMEASSCFTQRKWAPDIETRANVHYLLGVVPRSIVALIYDNQIIFRTLPSILIFYVDFDFFANSGGLVGDNLRFSLSDSRGDHKEYRLSSAIRVQAAHATVRVKSDGVWFEIDNHRVKKLPEWKVVDRYSKILIYEEIEVLKQRARKRSRIE